MKSTILLLFVFISAVAFGQNYPEDPELNDLTIKKEAYYRQFMKAKEYDKARPPLQWIYKNVPNFHESIYMKGAQLYEALYANTDDPKLKNQFMDTVLWTYDQRNKYFGDTKKVMNRKAYTAFKYYYKTPQKFEIVYSLYEDIFKNNEQDLVRYNLVPLMSLAANYHKARPEEFPLERLLETYDVISASADYLTAQGRPTDNLKSEIDKVDALLTSTIDLSCEFIKENLASKLTEEDLGLAKKIVRYSLSSGCSNEPFFVTAAEMVYSDDPQPGLARAIGDKYLVSKNYQQALEYYDKALDGDLKSDSKFKVLLNKAKANKYLGRKSTARTLAYEAAKINPSNTEPYNLIGDMYFASFEDCKKGVSKVEDRAIFIAAYEMYKKAGNSGQMSVSKEQFPSMEEIFSDEYEVGQTIEINCWINTSVTLSKRD